MVDGGTEGFKGHARVILPGVTPCFDCTLWLFPPQVTFPLCTLAETPRSPVHCIEYAHLILWEKQRPDERFDADNEEHMQCVRLQHQLWHGCAPLCGMLRSRTARCDQTCRRVCATACWSKSRFATRRYATSRAVQMFDRATERAAEFSIPGVTLQLTQGVVKNIIPAIPSTNAIVAAACVLEAFKLLSNCYPRAHLLLALLVARQLSNAPSTQRV